jgi:hypothetical protein
MRRGARYLRRTQQRDGGFALGGGGLTNSQSTAWAIQGLVAAGVSPSRVRDHGRSPLDYLSARQRGDGHYAYSSSSDQTPVWVTGQALVAAKRAAFPLHPVPRPERHRGSPAGRDQDSSGTSGSASPAPASGSVPATAAAGGAGGGGGGSSGSSSSPGVGRAGKGDEPHDSKSSAAAPAAPAEPRAQAVPLSAPVEPAALPSADDGSDTVPYVVGGLATLAAALVAGFLWYRRRLP